jgi:hypothetical protein
MIMFSRNITCLIEENFGRFFWKKKFREILCFSTVSDVMFSTNLTSNMDIIITFNTDIACTTNYYVYRILGMGLLTFLEFINSRNQSLTERASRTNNSWSVLLEILRMRFLEAWLLYLGNYYICFLEAQLFMLCDIFF